MKRFLQAAARSKQVDLEAWENYLRRAVLSAGAGELERLLDGVGSGRSTQSVVCECGRVMKSVGRRSKKIKTILGPVRFARSLYVCKGCGASRFPGDELLGIEGTSFSPGARRMMARAGSRSSFAEAEEDLRIYANLDVDRKDIERTAEQVGARIAEWMDQQHTQALEEARHIQWPEDEPEIPNMYVSFDGTGLAMRRAELTGRAGKQPDGSAKTREVKLGCVFTQTSLDKEGKPIRDPASTTYTGAIQSSDEFGWRIYAEALTGGLERARRVVVITDGAAYNKSIVEEHFPQAIHIIDLYHAREHLHDLTALLFPDEKKREGREQEWLNLLDDGLIQELIAQATKHLPRSGKRRKDARKEIEYFRKHTEQMRYGEFRSQGLFVGSGVVEAGCKSVIGARLKRSGMFWSVAGANAIIASRCCQYSGRFEQFWEDMAG